MFDTTQEWFDIVDENNNLLGITKPRDIVHKEMKEWHRATGIWIVNDKKEFLCQQRSTKKDVDPGEWQPFVGGHLHAGESYEENAVNELREELGLAVDKKELISVSMYKSEKYKHFSQLYLFRWNGPLESLHFNDGEVEQVRWMSISEFEQVMKESGKVDYTFRKDIVQALESMGSY